MVRTTLPYAATLACVAMFFSGCAIPSVPPTTTVWNKLGIPQVCDSWNANWINRKGNHPQWEKKPPLKRIADPANLLSDNPAIKAAAEIKAEQDKAPQKIKALKYLATIGCGCYDKEGKVEAAILAGLNDCTEEVRKTAAETVLSLSGNCACTDGCGNGCCTEKIQEKLQDMAYGETDGCWHEPSAEVRAIAMQALAACPPISVPTDMQQRETVPTPAIPERETTPDVSEPLPPIPPPTPMEASAAPVVDDEEFVQLTSAADEAAPVTKQFYAPISVDFVEEVAAEPKAPAVPVQAVEIAPVQTVVQTSAVSQVEPMVIADDASDDFVTEEAPLIIDTKIEFVLAAKSLAVMHLPIEAQVQVGQKLPVLIHSRRGNHTVEGNVVVKSVDGSLVHVQPVDGLALRVLRPGSEITVGR